MQLPFTGLTEEFKVTRVREVLLYRDSTDTRVSSSSHLELGGSGGHRRQLSRQKQGSDTACWQGLWQPDEPGLVATQDHSTTKPGGERCQLIQGEICAEVKEEHQRRPVAVHKQRVWTNWDHTTACKITWAEIWKTEPTRIQSVSSQPALLRFSYTPACPLFSLSCCPKALGEEKYRWRHDQVLKAEADTICIAIQQSKNQLPIRHNIAFVGR